MRKDEPGRRNEGLVSPLMQAAQPVGRGGARSASVAPTVARHPVQPRAVTPGVPPRASTHARLHPIQPTAAGAPDLFARIARDGERVLRSVPHAVADGAASAAYAPYYAAYSTQNAIHRRSRLVGHLTAPYLFLAGAPSIGADVAIDYVKERAGWERSVEDEHVRNWHFPRIWLPGLYRHRSSDGASHLSLDWSW